MVVNRWRRYGMDRLYVETPDGAKVGFWDLAADVGHPDSPDQEVALSLAVAGWRAESGTATAPAVAPPAAPAAIADAPATAVEPPLEEARAPRTAEAEPVRPWLDLATNRAGAEAREQARSARDAAPVKTLLARVLGVHTDERAWRLGADGEEKVAAQLEKVARKDPRWRSLHAIPVGNRGSDIDHLVVGPGGIFTVNAKHHPGAKIWVSGSTVSVNGTKVPYVRNARHEAARATTLLTAACGFPVHVEGLVVTVGAADVTVRSQPDGVTVTWRNDLAAWLLRHGDVLAPETLDAVYEVARRSTTWRP